MTASATCPEGLYESSYYDFYSAGAWTEEPSSTVDLDVILIAEGQTCYSDDYTIDYGYDVQGCAQAVVDIGYQFFSYDPEDGECRYEETGSGECYEGLYESTFYDFYAAYGWSSDVVDSDQCGLLSPDWFNGQASPEDGTSINQTVKNASD